MGFAQDIKDFVQKAEQSMSDNVNKVVEDLFTFAVVLSPSPSNPGPYAKGLLANQWYASITSPSSEVSLALNPNGSDSIARIKSMIAEKPFLGKDNVVYLSNNTEEAYYANRLGWEKGKGTNGWVWSGNSYAYQMTELAVIHTQMAYT